MKTEQDSRPEPRAARRHANILTGGLILDTALAIAGTGRKKESTATPTTAAVSAAQQGQ